MNTLVFKYIVLVCVLAGPFLSRTTSCYASNADSLTVEELGRASLKLVYSKPDEALQKIEEGFAMCIKLEDDKLWSLMYNYKGIYYDVTGKYDSAMMAYRQAVSYAHSDAYWFNRAGAINNIGLLFWNQRVYDSALTYYFQSLELYTRHNKLQSMANVYGNIGLIYNHQERNEESLEYSRKALSIRRQLEDPLGIGKSLANIGGTLEKMELYDSSLYYTMMAEPYLIASKNNYELGTLYHDIGVTYNLKNMPNLALPYAKKAIALRNELGTKRYIASTHSLLGKLYYKIQQYQTAHLYLDSAIAIYHKYHVEKDLKLCYQRKARIYRDQGNHAKASEYYELVLALTESLYDRDKIDALLDIEEKYENEKAKSQILAQDKLLLEERNQSERLTLGILVLSVLMLGLFLFFRNRILQNKANKKQELLKQKLSIARELHDNIGSQLTYLNHGIEKVIKNGDNKKLEQINRFSRSAIKDLRTTVWGLNQSLNTTDLGGKISEEVANVKSIYDNIKINTSINVSETQLDSTEAITLFRIVQEAIQNACKHAEATSLDIRLHEGNGAIEIVVKDDGKGMSDAHGSKGFGLKSMRQRAKKLDARLIIDSIPGSGTTVSLHHNTTNALYA